MTADLRLFTVAAVDKPEQSLTPQHLLISWPPREIRQTPEQHTSGVLIVQGPPFGWQPHWFGVPPPPQVFVPEQLPQVSVPVQPSEIVPQFLPVGHVVAGVQPHWFGVPPPPHVCRPVHAFAGQVMVPLQPSLIVPHCPNAQAVFGVQAVAPHLFGPAPPQFGVLPEQPGLLQSNVSPQPVGTVPHSAPCAAHV